MREAQQRRGSIQVDSRVHGRLGRRVCHRPFGTGDAQPKSTEKEDMNLSRNVKISSCQTRDNETEIESPSDGSITEEQSAEKEEMIQKDVNVARCSVEAYSSSTNVQRAEWISILAVAVLRQ